MGSSESSSFECIEDLSKTIASLEQRLAAIESLPLQDPAPLSSSTNYTHDGVDNVIHIHKVQIQTRSSVKLCIGPIVGRTSHNSSRILLEVQHQSISSSSFIQKKIPLTLNLFQMNASTSSCDFLRTDLVELAPNIPTAVDILHLLPDMFYLVYIGGIPASDVYQQRVVFRTFPFKQSSLKVACMTSALCDCETPDEISALFPQMMPLLPSNNLPPHGLLASSKTSSSIYEKSDCIHLTVFVGNTISVGHIVSRLMPGLVRCLFDYNLNDSPWKERVIDLRNAVGEHYRGILNSPNLNVVLRSCSCLFISGAEETAVGELRKIELPCGDNEDVEEVAFRALFMKLILRNVRHVEMQYYRQLWDDEAVDMLGVNVVEMEGMMMEIAARREVAAANAASSKAERVSTQAQCKYGSDSPITKELSNLAHALEKRKLIAEERLRSLIMNAPPLRIAGSYASNPIFQSRGGLREELRAPIFQNHQMLQLGSYVFMVAGTSWEIEGDDFYLDLTELELSAGSSLRSCLGLKESNMKDSMLLQEKESEIETVAIFSSRPIRPSLQSSSSFLQDIFSWMKNSMSRSFLLMSPSASMTPYSSLGILEFMSKKDDVIHHVGSADCVLLGALNGLAASRVRSSSHAKFAYEEEEAPSISDQLFLKFIPKEGSESYRRSFWVVDTKELLGGKCITDLDDAAVIALTLGPIIGRVTPTSVTIALEIHKIARQGQASSALKYPVEVELSDVASGVRVQSIQLVACDEIATLVVDGLQPGHCYDINIITTNGCEVTPTCAHRGCVTLPPSRYFETIIEVEAVSNTVAVREIRGSQLHTDNRNENPEFLSPSFQMIIVGPNMNQNISKTLLQAVSGLISQPWSSIDCILHLGSPVNLHPYIDEIIRFLSLAEKDVHNQGIHLRKAEQVFRDAYRLHWGADFDTGFFLSQSQHWIVSSPVYDLLHLFDVDSLVELRRDALSVYCFQQLLFIAESLHKEFCRTMWNPYEHLISSSSSQRLKQWSFFCNDHVICFELMPEVRLTQDANSGFHSDLVDHLQLRSLSNLLATESTARSLLVVSPLPLLVGDVVFTSHYGDLGSRPLAYTISDVKSILDIICQWMALDPSRACTLLTGSFKSTVPRHTIIDVVLHSPTAAYEHGSHIQLDQVCVSPTEFADRKPNSGTLPSKPHCFASGIADYAYHAVASTIEETLDSLILLRVTKDASALRHGVSFHSTETLDIAPTSASESQEMRQLAPPYS